jgi:DNA-binding transcriptional MerR regulator
MSLEDLLSTEETAELLGITADLLRHWRVRGKGPTGRLVGRTYIYCRRDVERWRDAQSARSTA